MASAAGGADEANTDIFWVAGVSIFADGAGSTTFGKCGAATSGWCEGVAKRRECRKAGSVEAAGFVAAAAGFGAAGFAVGAAGFAFAADGLGARLATGDMALFYVSAGTPASRSSFGNCRLNFRYSLLTPITKCR